MTSETHSQNANIIWSIFEPPHPLEAIEVNIKPLENEIMTLPSEVTA